MGYRHKIGILEKTKHEEIRGMTYKQLQKWYGDEYIPIYEITKEVYELGKYVDDSYLKPHSLPVFDKKIVQKKMNEDQAFYIITQDGFKAIIDQYHKDIADYFRKLKENTFDEYSILRGSGRENYFDSKLDEWDNKYNINPYSLEGENLVGSWKYEYAIFELVRIYKSVNWETQLVTITAW